MINPKFRLTKSLIIIMSFLLLFSIPVQAANYENSPRGNYNVYVHGESIDLFDKPKGKKIVTLKSFGELNEGPKELLLVVKQFVKDNYWVKVNATAINGKKYTGYVRNKFISPNYNSWDHAFINHTSGLNLRAKPSTKAKKVVTIPYGTRVDITSNNDIESNWLNISYVVKGKKYEGFVSRQYVKE